MRLSRVGLVAAVASLALFMGGGAPSPKLAEAQVAAVTERGISVFGRQFGPRSQKVPSGYTVRFVNGDRVAHNVITVANAAPVEFGPLALAARPSGTAPCVDRLTDSIICPNQVVGPFTTLGKYQFVCTIHRRMAGSFEVVNTGPAPTPTPRGAATNTPAAASVPRTISILGRSASPKIMRVKQGTDLYFANGASEQHWLKSVIAEGTIIDPSNPPLDFDTGAIGARSGGTADPANFTRVGPFTVASNTRPGRYGYVCLIYPSMSGAIIVERVDPNA